MASPIPKKPGQRRNANKKRGGEWQTLDGNPYEGPRPRKPPKLCAFSTNWWDTAWESPVSSQWEPDDRLEVVRLALLADRIGRDPERPMSVDAEFRQLLDRLGLTRKGRLANRYELPEVEVEEEAEVVGSGRWGHLAPVDDDG